MARNRMIKPEFWEDEKIGTLSLPARLLFLACLNFADDEGLIRWNSSYLNSCAFVYDDFKQNEIEKLMNELIENKFIYAYKMQDTKAMIGWIINFHKHQRIDHPQPSKFPAPNLTNINVRRIYAEREKMICYICGEEMNYESQNIHGSKRVSLDHVKPKSKGGSDYPSNIRAVHISCNKSKQDDYFETVVVNDSQNDSQNDSRLKEVNIKEVNIIQDNVKEIKTSRIVFVKPTKTEIIDYINEKQLKVDSETFFDHYESNGWKVGKVPMKDWKATLRNWDRKTKEAKRPFKNEFLDKLEQERAI